MGVATSVCKMMGGMFITAIDGYDGLKISLSIAGTVKNDLSSLIFGPKMEGLALSEDFCNAPCLAAYVGSTYLFYPDGSTLKYATYSATGWSASAMTVPGAQPMAGASAVAFNGLLYVFYQGPSQGLWYNVFNGAGWSAPVQVTLASGTPSLAASPSTCSPTITVNVPLTKIPVGAQYASAPSAVVFETQLYVFYQSSNGQQLRYSVFNGTSWIQDAQVSGATVSCSPSAVVYNGVIYVIYQGEGKNGGLYCNTFAGSSWASGTQIPSSAGVSSSPQACVFNGNIVVVHEGNDDSTNVYYLYFNGSGWSSDIQLLPSSLSYAPAPVVFNGELLVFMQDKNQQGELYYTTSNGSAWSPMTQVEGASITNQPAPVVFNNQLYVFYGGPDNSKIYYSRCTTNWSWSSAMALNPICVSAGPSTICFENDLVCLFQNQTQLFCTLYDTSAQTWTPPAPLPVNVVGAVSAVAFTPAGAATQLYVFYQAAGASGEVGGLWYITLEPSTLAYSNPVQIAGTSILGSPSAVVSGSDLSVFYQSAGSCCQAVFDGTTWTNNSTGIALKESPSAVVLDGSPCFFYQGATNANLYVARPTTPGEAWAWTNLNCTLSCSPSAAVFNGEIYVFFQGQNYSGALFYLTYSSDGSTTQPAQVPNLGTSDSPSATVANGELHVLHEGWGDNGQLWHDSMGSSGTWNGDTLVQSTVPLSSPCVVSYKNVIYSFYESYGQLCYSINAGGTSFWTTQQLVPNVSLSGTPSAAVFNGVMYIFYQSSSGGELLYVTCDSSGTFSSPATVTGASITTGQSPSATAFGSLLYVFYPSGAANDSSIAYSTFNGSAWQGPVGGLGTMANSPSAVVYAPEGGSEQLYLFFSQSNGWLYVNLFDGSSWAGANPVGHYPVITGSPSATATPSSLYVAYQASDNSGVLYYSALMNGSWSVPAAVPGAQKMTGSPALAALNTYSVWVIYANAAGQLFYNVLSGVNSWETQLQLIPSNKDSGTNLLSNAPSAAVYNGQLYVAYKGHGDTTIWYNSSSDGNSWGPQTQASNGGLDGSPSLVAYNDQLYLFHTGDSNDGKLGCTVMTSNGVWCADTQIYEADTQGAVMTAGSVGPSAAVFGGRIYCFINAKNSALGYVIIDSSMTFGTSHPTVPLLTVYTDSAGTAIQTTSPGAVAYNGTLYSFVNSLSNSLAYVSSTNPPTAPDTSAVDWGSLQQAGFGGATSNGGGSVLGVVVEQTAAIAEPFIGAYLVPGNLANTAFIEQGANGPKWVKPTWTLATDV